MGVWLFWGGGGLAAVVFGPLVGPIRGIVGDRAGLSTVHILSLGMCFQIGVVGIWYIQQHNSGAHPNIRRLFYRSNTRVQITSSKD